MADRPVLRFIGESLAGRAATVPITPAGAKNLGSIAGLFAGAAADAADHADAAVAQNAQEAGALAGFGGFPDRKKGHGIRARAFNEAAMSSMMLRVGTESQLEFESLFQANQADPMNFLTEAEAYSEGVASGIESVDPSLAEAYRLKARTDIFRIHSRVAKNADVAQGEVKEGNLVRAELQFGKNLQGYLEDILSIDLELAETAMTAMLQDFGALMVSYRTQKLSDGTPMRTPEQVAKNLDAFRTNFSTMAFKTMVEKAGSEEEIQEMVKALESGDLIMPIVEYSNEGPSLRGGVPIEVFNVDQMDALENFALSEIRDRAMANERRDARARSEFKKQSVVVQNAMSKRGAVLPIDFENVPDSEVVAHEDAMQVVYQEWSAKEELFRKNPIERADIIDRAKKDESADGFNGILRFEFLRKADQEMRQEIERDAKQFILDQNPDFRDKVNVEIGPEVGPEAANQELDRLYDEHGVFRRDRRYATNTEADSISRRITQSESGKDLIDAVVAVQAEFGSKGQDVINEGAVRRKINPQVGILANLMLRDEDGQLNADAITYADILKARKADGSPVTTASLRLLLGSETDARDIDNSIRLAMDEFNNTFLAGQIGAVDQYHEAATTLAYTFATKMDRGDAVDRAILALLPYEFQGTMRVPKNIATPNIMDTLSRPELLFDMFLEKGAVFDPAAGLDLDEFSDVQAVAAHRTSSRRVGIPIISERENGVSFLDAHFVPLLDAKGEPMVVTWDEIEKLNFAGVAAAEVAEAASFGARKGLAF